MKKQTTNQTYAKSSLASVHEAVSDLRELGLVSSATMREFDELCLTPVVPLSPEEILELRVQARMSQAVFARYLNVSTSLVSQWERGERSPSGPSLKLLTLIRTKGIQAVA